MKKLFTLALLASFALGAQAQDAEKKDSADRMQAYIDSIGV